MYITVMINHVFMRKEHLGTQLNIIVWTYPQKGFYLSTRSTPLCKEVDYNQLIFVVWLVNKIIIFLLLKYERKKHLAAQRPND